MKTFTNWAKLFLLLPAFLTAQVLQAQPAGCATMDGKVKWLKDYQANPTAFPESGDHLYVAMTIHIVGDNAGEGYIKSEEVRRAFCELNEDFLPSDIQFFIAGEFNYIDNSNYYQHNWQQGGQMMNIHRVENTINVYFVDDPAGACGYSAYNNGIALSNNCVDPNSSTWAHEVGHYLSLPHTFSGWEGSNYDYDEPAPNQIDGYPVERVDGSNCGNAGDGFCDTAPDYLNYRWNCDNAGFSVTTQLDPAGIEFTSDGNYFMSYSFDGCANLFSPGQIDAMRANVLDEKADHLWEDAPIEPVDFSNFTVISPAVGSTLEDYSNITFEWAPMPNATQYVLEISPLPVMQFVLYRYELSGTSISIDPLNENQTFYWRLQAFNNWHTCKEFTPIQSFSTGTLNSVSSIQEIQDLTLRPNPVGLDQSVMVRFQNQRQLTVQITLLNLNGAALQVTNRNLAAGQQEVEISTANLTTGVYFLQVQSESGLITRKLVITE